MSKQKFLLFTLGNPLSLEWESHNQDHKKYHNQVHMIQYNLLIQYNYLIQDN